jgi:pimeloyl-ACP methyl ester carboxylesterase
MDWIVPQFAKRFAEAGYAALIFDYRYFGESEGEPRQLVDIKQQREDIRAAVDFVRHQPTVDRKRAALWGTSLGGGHVFYVAADDPSIAAVICQVPGFDMVSARARALIKIPLRTIAKLMLVAVWDGARGVLGLSPHYTAVFGKPGELAIFTDPKLMPLFDRVQQESKHWRNYFTPRFYLGCPDIKKEPLRDCRCPSWCVWQKGRCMVIPRSKCGSASRPNMVRCWSMMRNTSTSITSCSRKLSPIK